MVGYDGAGLLDIICTTSVFEMASYIASGRLYEVEVVSPRGRPIVGNSGLELSATGSLQRVNGPIDTLLVSGGLGHEQAAADTQLVAHVRRLAAVSRRVGSVSTGSSVLAAAGLLDGHRATTHWYFAEWMAHRYPAITVDATPIYIHDNGIYTSAGITSTLDLALAMVQDDHDAVLARDVARMLVTYLQRPGNQAQMSMFVAPDVADHKLVRDAVAYITGRAHEHLTTSDVAERCGVSERQLNRLFHQYAGQTPGRLLRRTRTEMAAQLLTTTDLPVTQIAHRCGFGTAEALRQAFIRHYGVPPTRYRSAHARSPASRS